MISRSTPPASAALADSPVPAPAPMIGRLAARGRAQPGQRRLAVHRPVAHRLSSSPPRPGPARPADHPVHGVGGAAAEARVVDRRVDVVDDHAAPGEPRGQGLEQGGVRVGVGERRAGHVDRGHPAARHEHLHRSGGGGQLARDRGAELGALAGRGAHQRHRRVVHVEPAPGEPLGDRLPRPEVHHVQRPRADHLRDAAPARRLEPVGAGAEHPADQLVGELGGGQVEDAGEQAGRGEALHGPAAGAVAWKTSTS
jgi:hypothetical protein